MFKTASPNTTKVKPNHSGLFGNGKDADAFIQPKLNIGKPGDAYEVEADRVADTIVARGNDRDSAFFAPAPAIQRQTQDEEIQEKCAECEKEDSQVQQKPLVETITPMVRRQAEEEPLQEKANEQDIQRKGLLEDSVQQKPDSGFSVPEVQKQEEEVQEKEEEEEVEVQQKSKWIQLKDIGTPVVTNSVESRIQRASGNGQPMSKDVKHSMESGFGTDFSGVRVHTDSNSVQMNKELGAQAFTHGNDIYFNEGKYEPQSNSGKHLLAHELTHTVQQGASVQRKPISISSAPKMIQGFGILDLIPNWIISGARHIPGYTLFTVLIEYDPLLGQTVERTPINLTEGLMGLVPFGTAIFDKLQEYGIIQNAFDWISGQLNSLHLTSQGLLDLVEEAWEEVSFPYTNIISVITDKFQQLIGRIRTFASSLVDQILTWIKEALIGVAEPILAENRAWSLIKKIIHYDPLRDVEVVAPTVEILEDFLILIGKETELEQMRERGTLQETADWLDTQIGTFRSLLSQLRGLITSAWDAIQPRNLPNILENLRNLAIQAAGFLQGVWTFASTVAIQVLELIKNALLAWLNSFAADIPGFTLLTVILAKNPLTGEDVPRSVENIIRGFMGLVPGGEAKFQELKQSGVVPRAAGQIEALIAELGFSLAFIIQLFTDLWNSFSINDLLNPIAAFQRIVSQFGEPIRRLFTFVVKVVKVLVVLILEIMGIPPDMIGNIIANAMAAFEDIKNDPIGFLLNLMNAVKNGFLQFLGNIGTHLLNGLQNWLFGTLADAGVQIPADLSIRSLLGMAMDVLGITVDNILERLALKIGEERVAQIRAVLDTLTGIWAFVRDVIERGPIAIWEYIQSQISNLWNIIKEGIMGFIQEKVIQQAIGWLLSFLDVTGIMPVIRGVQTVFNAIMSFIEKLREILGIVNSFVAGVADIARGSIVTAASFLETALADGIPIAISFLAKQLGLGDISEKIAEMIENTREMINEGIDWLIDRAMAAGTAFLNALGLGGGQEGEEESARDADDGMELGSIEATFNDEDNESHRLYINIQGNNAVVMMASNEPDDLHTKIQKEQSEDEVDSSEQEAELLTADQLRAQLVTFIEGHLANSETQETESIRAEIQTRLNAIKEALVAGGIDSEKELPLTTTTFGMDGNKAGSITAEPLTKLPGNTQGQALTSGSSGPQIVGDTLANASNSVTTDETTSSGRARRLSVDWRRVHLLSHRHHGPLSPWNLSWNKTQANSDFEKYEHAVADGTRISKYQDKGIDKGFIYSYHVQVNYNPSSKLYNGEGTEVGDLADYARDFTLVIKRKERQEDNFDTIDNETIDGTTQAPAMNVQEVKEHLKQTLRKRILKKTEELYQQNLPNSWSYAASRPSSVALRRLSSLGGANDIEEIKAAQVQKRQELLSNVNQQEDE